MPRCDSKSCNHSYVNFFCVCRCTLAFHAQMLMAPTQCEERISQIQKYSSRDLSVLAVPLEQTFEYEQRHHQLAKLQSGAEAARLIDHLMQWRAVRLMGRGRKWAYGAAAFQASLSQRCFSVCCNPKRIVASLLELSGYAPSSRQKPLTCFSCIAVRRVGCIGSWTAPASRWKASGVRATTTFKTACAIFQRSYFSSDRHAVVPSTHPETEGQVMEARHSRSPRATRSESIEKTWAGRFGRTGAGITATAGCEWQRSDPRSGLNRFTTLGTSMTVAAR